MKSSFFVLHSGVLSFLLGVKVRLSQVVKVFLQAKFVSIESSPYTEISDLDKVTKFNPITNEVHTNSSSPRNCRIAFHGRRGVKKKSPAQAL